MWMEPRRQLASSLGPLMVVFLHFRIHPKTTNLSDVIAADTHVPLTLDINRSAIRVASDGCTMLMVVNLPT